MQIVSVATKAAQLEPHDFHAKGSAPEGEGRKLRRHARAKTDINAFVVLSKEQRIVPIKIVNLSKGGLAFTGAYSTLPGEQIVIELLNGRKLYGNVRWWLNSRCGIQFKTELLDTDPLLVSGKPGTATASSATRGRT